MSIRELRQICYPPQKEQDDPIFARIFVRKFSIYFTWIFISLKVSANAVTVMSIVVGLIGCFCLGFKNLNTALIGIILLYVGYILDCSDGEVARYWKKSNISGMYLDLYGHHLIVPLIFLAYGLHLFQSLHNMFFVIVGGIAGIVSMRISGKIRERVLMQLIFKNKGKDFFGPYSNFKMRLENVSPHLNLESNVERKIGNKLFRIVKSVVTQLFRHLMFLAIFSSLVIAAFFIPEIYPAIIFIALCCIVILREIVTSLWFGFSNTLENDYLLSMKMVKQNLDDWSKAET